MDRGLHNINVPERKIKPWIGFEDLEISKESANRRNASKILCVSLGADYLRKHWKLILIHWSTFEMFNNTDWGVVVNVILFTKLLCIIAIIEAIAQWWHNQPQPGLSWRTKWRRCQNIGWSIFIMQWESMW